MANKKKTEEPKKWCSQISGAMKIHLRTVGKGKKAFDSYSTSISIKDEESGKWSNLYLDVGFKKDQKPNEDLFDKDSNTMINVKSGFMTFREWEDNDGNLHQVPKVVVMDYDSGDDLPF